MMNHQEFSRYRTILAYHGCDQSVADKVLLQGEQLHKSEKSYDWLGSGIYFWEHGPNRALEWAKSNPKITTPAVVGAVINLGNCFDLFDRHAVQTLADLFPSFKQGYEDSGKQIPSNRPGFPFDGDHVKRDLDCAVVNWSLDLLENKEIYHDSVRGLFPEGEAAFEGSSIMTKSHIQIAVRNTACVIGYFKPKLNYER